MCNTLRDESKETKSTMDAASVTAAAASTSSSSSSSTTGMIEIDC